MAHELTGILAERGGLKGELTNGKGGSGTNNYPDLNNLPKINGVTLIDNKTAAELGIIIPTKTSQLENDSHYVPISIVDSIIDDLLPTDNATGAVAAFSTSLARVLLSLRVEIDYDAGGIGSVNIYQRGTNLWDEQWEVGTYNTNTGEKSSSSTRIRSKNLFPIPHGTTLFITPIGSGGNGLSFLFYGKDKTFKNGYYRGSTAGGFTFNIQSDWYYMAISPNEAYGTTYNDDISINNPSINTNYSAFIGSVKTIDISEYSVYGGYIDITPAGATLYSTKNADGTDKETPDVYDLSDIDDLITLIGTNNIYADSGNIAECKFKDGIQHYIDKLV